MKQDRTGGAYLPRGVRGHQSPLVHLWCGGRLADAEMVRWRTADLADYLVYLIDGRPCDSLFRAVLFSPNRAPSGRFLNPVYTGFTPPADAEDWQAWLDELFHPGYNLSALAAAAASGPPAVAPVDVWITVPYPDPRLASFRTGWGSALHFAHTGDRVAAVTRFVDDLLHRWRQAGLCGTLRLRGLRWPRTVLDEADADVIAKVSEAVHAAGLDWLWLTHYGAARAADWAQLGFDAAVLHPNCYGRTVCDRQWIHHAALFARVHGCGLHLVFGRGLLHHPRDAYDYLNLGLPGELGYVDEAFCVVSFPGTSPRTLYEEDLPLYIAVYSFAKGILRMPVPLPLSR
ncbi:hypothetical protein GCM10010885_14500 [Alicyclobacillus cellulosilyticus]|uniref:Uncharacterized protein n=1 Tax=Alicyclobacillus cellulosilyticus TaxID=1003997 RepID=A0A917NJW9_9BACL|nr:DUF4855 domain-containing protein [Alicyclobacillus cellulosilyticus]GGJ06414.1 hypothetical protein GCM10010885_14500 [Alicyclobacillus cellulosilyticus]